MKVTCQLLNIASNSVHFTLVLAAAAVIETINNLKILFRSLNVESLCGEGSNDEIGISVDMKVCPMLYGITGGNALYPCPMCLWYKHDGFTCVPQDPRTMQHIIEMHRTLQDKYNGNREKSKFVYSVETLPILHQDPQKILKIPTVHLHLMTNDAYKELKSRITEEQRLLLDTQRKAAGVVESRYEGGTLQGNQVYKFVKAVVANKISIPIPEFYDLFTAMDWLRHTCFGNTRKEGSQDAVENFVRCWESAGMGVGVKAHIVQHHVIPSLLQLKSDEGLGLWSEQAAESAHAAFKKVFERYEPKKQGLLHAIKQYNFNRM